MKSNEPIENKLDGLLRSYFSEEAQRVRPPAGLADVVMAKLGSTPQIEATAGPRFSKGDRVFVPALGNKAGIVDGEPRLLRGKWVYPVSFDPAQESPYYPEDALTTFAKPPSVKELMATSSFAEADRFLLSLIYRSLEKPLSDNLYTFYASRTEFQVHQFKPVLKFLMTDKQRLLLADEVGLGKTIEAGIIITEQEARLGGLSRVLIVCPAMLVEVSTCPPALIP